MTVTHSKSLTTRRKTQKARKDAARIAKAARKAQKDAHKGSAAPTGAAKPAKETDGG